MEKFLGKILRYDITVILFFVFIFFLGVVCASRLQIAYFPSYQEPVLSINTYYHQMAPDIIEEMITRPIEGLLKEVKGIKDFYSFSSRGMSKIVVYLYPGEHVDKKAVLIKDKLYHISDAFPMEVPEPAIYRYNPEEKPVMILSLSSPLIGNELKRELLSVEGVANVELGGVLKQEYFVEQNYGNMIRLKTSFHHLFEEIKKNNISVPLGSIDAGNRLIRLSFPNRYTDILNISRFPVYTGRGVVPGRELFCLEKRSRYKDTISFVDNRPCFTMYVFKKDPSNILKIDREIKHILKDTPNAASVKWLYNQADYLSRLLLQLGLGAGFSLLLIFLIGLFYFKKPVYP
ncbi:MAG: efflux RND transporter permease subunit, partial [Spirochaetota bacterium]